MEFLSLFIYAGVTVFILLHTLGRGKGGYYEFPFWISVIALGWFFPLALRMLPQADSLPENMYTLCMLYASLCNLFMWVGFSLGRNRPAADKGWLAVDFSNRKLYLAGALMCLFGWYFHMKLNSLPTEMLEMGRWTGASVKYLFFANLSQLGFIILWLLYVSTGKWMSGRLLLFLLPCLFLLIQPIVFHGRRGEMMNFFSYIFVSLWFVRRIALPRWLLIAALCSSMVVVNGIGLYRGIMKDKDVPLQERLKRALTADYRAEFEKTQQGGGTEFRNYVYLVSLYQETGRYDFGGFHWNELVFNYVPAQIIGRDRKQALMLNHVISAREAEDVLAEEFNYQKPIGTTITGYAESFGSFGWLGWIKFLLVGFMMGTLYRHAMNGRFLGQLLYAYVLGTSMHIVSHETHRILISIWVYFFLLCYPLLFLARQKTVSSAPETAS